MHTKVKTDLNPEIHIGGPYWGLNILMWAKGIITNPGFALGSGFQYYTPGGRVNQPSQRMAIPPLRRWARANLHLEKWLKKSITKVKGLPEEKEFEKLLRKYNNLKMNKEHKKQIAQEYFKWYMRIESIPYAGRAVALYQDLSKAFVLGSQLEDINSESGTNRKPEIVARQLMLNCL